ncbi:Sulfotransferase 1C2, partial [Stegodyphus mimosarum]
MSDSASESKTEEKISKYPLVYLRGLPFPAFLAAVGNVEKAIDFKPDDDDIFIVTYPKCGTTWTQFIVWEIINKGAVPPSPNQMMFQHVPFLEVTGPDALEALSTPRIIKTHLPFHLQPYNPSSKYIYIIRNPWDCCVSYYYHHQMDTSQPQLTFDKYFELFITGELGWGDYFDHILSWYSHRNDPNVLLLTYEEMKKDAKKAFFTIAKFLGDSYYKDLLDKNILENCLKHSDFKYMKSLGMFFPSFDEIQKDAKKFAEEIGKIDRENAKSYKVREVNFFRKGEIGDWKNHFSQVQIERFNEYMSKKLKGTELENFWQPLMAETSL